MSIEYVELTITDAEPINITISDIPEAAPGGGSSLTVREVDGSPTGTATTLVFPNGSVTFDGSTATITGLEGPQGATGPQGEQGPAGTPGEEGAPGPNQVTTSTATNITGLIKGNGSSILQAVAGTDYVATTDARLGKVYDVTNDQVALSCDDTVWTFADTTTRDNLRTTLQAVATSDHDTTRAAIRERISVALSGYDTAVSTGDGKGFARVRVGGQIESVTIDCDPNNEPSVVAIIVDCSKVNRSTGTATSVLSSLATISTGANTATGTLNGTQTVSAGDLLRFDVDQGSDGKELIATVVINPFL